MKDIITFGAASWDIFLDAPYRAVQGGANTDKSICLGLGSKIEIKDIYFSTGGGGTNTAASFAKQGFKTAYCGKIGSDIAGNQILKDLKKFKIDSSLVSKTKEKPTNHSLILNSSADGDRTILVYRGASDLLSDKDIPWKKIKSKWFYIAPSAPKSFETIKLIINFAKSNNIKIAFNPSISQILENPELILGIIKKIDILILNQEESSALTKIPYTEENRIFCKMDEFCDGIAIMTKGAKGAIVSDGDFIYRANAPEVKVLDRTGAGDAFASGFVSAFIKNNGNIEKSLEMGIANSISCIQDVGAKNGLLGKNDKFKPITVEKEKINKTCPI